MKTITIEGITIGVDDKFLKSLEAPRPRRKERFRMTFHRNDKCIIQLPNQMESYKPTAWWRGGNDNFKFLTGQKVEVHREYADGRTCIWISDIGATYIPTEFLRIKK